jgi:hypothetical protein
MSFFIPCCNTSGLPAIQDFIDKHSKQYGKALKISESMGAYPKIILKHKKTGGRPRLSACDGGKRLRAPPVRFLCVAR